MKNSTIAFVVLIITVLLTRLVHLLNDSYYWIINADSFYFHRLAELWQEGEEIEIFQSGLTIFLFPSPDILSIIVPVVLAFMIMYFLYAIGKDLYDSKAGLYSMFVFALLIPCIFITEAGSIDRDALILTLLLGAVFALINIIKLRGVWSGVLMFLMMIGLLVVLWFPALGRTMESLSWGVAELQPMSILQSLIYMPFIPLLAFGIKRLVNQRRYWDISLLAWLAVAFVAGCIMNRLMLFALPAICLVSGVGVVEIMPYIKTYSDKMVAYGFVIAIFVLAGWFAWGNSADSVMPRYWVEACEYIEQNTPEDSQVLTWWSNGNWVYDVAERDAFVMNTGKGHSNEKDKMVSYIYCDTGIEGAYNMARYHIGCDYLIFSDIEKHYPNAITDPIDYEGELEDTLWYRALEGDIDSDYFGVVYNTDKIVVLEVL